MGGNGNTGGNGGYQGDDAPGGFQASPTYVPGPSGTAQSGGPLTGADKLIDYTAINEGGGKYDAWTANDNGHGVSYGLVQFNQETGSLPTLLKNMRAADPAKFDSIMGPHASNMMDENWVRTANLNDPDIKSRMQTAARDPEFQSVQRQLAKTGYYDHAPVQAQKYMGVTTPSEKTIAALFDSNVQNGPGGTSKLLQRATRELGSQSFSTPAERERAIMNRFAYLADDRKYSNNRRTRIMSDPNLSDGPMVI